MPNPRTLRPGAKFTPKSVPGLALWLDGTDTGKMTTNEFGLVNVAGWSPKDITSTSIFGWWDANSPLNFSQKLQNNNGPRFQRLKELSNTGFTGDFIGGASQVMQYGPAAIDSGAMGSQKWAWFDDSPANRPMEMQNASQADFPKHIFYVYWPITPGGTGRYLSLREDNDDLEVSIGLNGSANVGVGSGLGGGSYEVLAPIPYAAGPQLLNVSYDSFSNVSIRRNFNSASATATAVSGTDVNLFSAVLGGAYSAPGSVDFVNGPQHLFGELIMFADPLSETDQRRVERWLCLKWGIQGTDPGATIAEQISAVPSPLSIGGCALWLDAADSSSLYTTDAGPVTAVNDPRDISGCVLWLDGADNATITASGGLVSQWTDKSASGAVLTASGSARPTLSSTGFNSRQALVFNGTSTTMASVSPYTATNGLSGMTRIAVCQNSTSTAVVARVFSGGSDMFVNMNGSWRSPVDSTGATNFVSSATFSNANNLPAGVYADVFSSGIITQYGFGSTATATINGTIPSTTGTGTPTLHVGSNIGANFFWNGPIAEVIYFNRALTRNELARVEAYLAAKWGISGVHAPATATSDPVGCWRDKSGNGRHATAAGASRPTAGTRTLNGRNVVAFDGSLNSMSVAADAAFNTTALTYFVVFKQDAPANKGVYTKLNQTAGTNGFALAVRSEANPVWLLQKNAALAQVLTSSADPVAQARIYSVTSSASANGYVNGVQAATASSSADHSLNQTVRIGSRESTEFLNGYIAEVIHYSTTLSVIDRARVEKYLAQKWGIAGVPDPTPSVGWWQDKSGNGRHATQATAANRPTLSIAVNTRHAVLMATGGVQRLTANSVYMDALGDDTNRRITIFAALQSSGQSQQKSIGEVDQSSGFGCYHNISNVAYFDAGAAAPASRASGALATSVITGGAIFSGRRNGGAVDQWYNGALIAGSITSATGSLRTAGDNPFSVKAVNSGSLAYGEVLVYNRALTTSERQRLERYLAAKWGITLAPQVSNPDAQDWINRVYANGSTVSATTAAAVNTFCDAIDNAGIRDRFYRLNLFCGGTSGTTAGLNAALVPLYRGPSVSNTFGNVTDTNSGGLFATSDYSEAAGLTGNGSTGNKYLSPGTPSALKPSWTTHHFGIDISGAYPDATARYQMGAFFNETPTSPRGNYAITGNSSGGRGDSGIPTRSGFTAAANLKMVIRESASDMRLFEDNSQVGATQITTDTATTVSASQFAIMASGFQNVSGGTPTTITNGYAPAVGTARGYTIGEAMNATERSAFVGAWVAVQQSLGRR